jgi:hypothetical protein
MTFKFLDYFSYALVADGTMDFNEEEQCFEKCGKDDWVDKCCASVRFYKQSSDLVDY